jgi:ketosteroid isomerase-like protein
MSASNITTSPRATEARMDEARVAWVIRKAFRAFEAHDREGLAALLSEDLKFSSPHDDRINKTAYMERCWPNSQTLGDFVLEQIFVQGDEAFVRYRARRTTDGMEFRNVEYMRIEGDTIKEIDVYFGRDLLSSVDA